MTNGNGKNGTNLKALLIVFGFLAPIAMAVASFSLYAHYQINAQMQVNTTKIDGLIRENTTVNEMQNDRINDIADLQSRFWRFYGWLLDRIHELYAKVSLPTPDSPDLTKK